VQSHGFLDDGAEVRKGVDVGESWYPVVLERDAGELCFELGYLLGMS